MKDENLSNKLESISQLWDAELKTDSEVRAETVITTLSAEEIKYLVHEVQKACNDALDKSCAEFLYSAIESMRVLDEKGLAALEDPSALFQFEWLLEQSIDKNSLGLQHFLSGKCAQHVLIMAAVKASVQLLCNPTLRLWCDAPSLFKECMRIAAIREKDRSDDDRYYLRILARCLSRPLLGSTANLPKSKDVLALAAKHPNFTEPATFIAEQAAVQRFRLNGEFKVQPMLLVGPPGAGKTHFAQALAELLGSKVSVLGLSSQSNGWVLCGLDRSWSSTKTGMILESILDGNNLAPVIVLDEIDKANQDSKSNPLGPLYQLLESKTAAAFQDESVGFKLDASHVVWIATANSEVAIPEAIRSRFRIFHIEDPDEFELGVIARQIYQQLTSGIAGADDEIPQDWLKKLKGRSIREIRLAIQQAIGRAALRAENDAKSELSFQCEDLRLSCNSTDKKMGFIL